MHREANYYNKFPRRQTSPEFNTSTISCIGFYYALHCRQRPAVISTLSVYVVSSHYIYARRKLWSISTNNSGSQLLPLPKMYGTSKLEFAVTSTCTVVVTNIQIYHKCSLEPMFMKGKLIFSWKH